MGKTLATQANGLEFTRPQQRQELTKSLHYMLQGNKGGSGAPSSAASSSSSAASSSPSVASASYGLLYSTPPLQS